MALSIKKGRCHKSLKPHLIHRIYPPQFQNSNILGGVARNTLKVNIIREPKLLYFYTGAGRISTEHIKRDGIILFFTELPDRIVESDIFINGNKVALKWTKKRVEDNRKLVVLKPPDGEELDPLADYMLRITVENLPATGNHTQVEITFVLYVIPVLDGLVVAWPLDEGTGGVSQDISRNGPDLEIERGWWINGKFNAGLECHPCLTEEIHNDEMLRIGD